MVSAKRSHILKQTCSFQQTKWTMSFSIIIKEHKFQEPQETLNFEHLAFKEIALIPCSIQCRGQKALVTASYASGSEFKPTCGHCDSWFFYSLEFESMALSIQNIISKLKYLKLLKYMHLKYEIFKAFFID